AYLSTSEMLPAVGQGALGIEARVDDHRANLLLEVMNHQPTRYATEAERAVLRSLGGGCAVPIAAFGHITKNRISQKLVVDALVADVEGRRLIRHQIGGPVQQAEELGAKLAEMLIDAGARELLPRIGSQTPLAVQTANGAADVEILAESLAQAPIAAPPEGGTTNYSAESFASIATTPEGGTTNYSAESFAIIAAAPEGGTPSYIAESLAPIAAAPEGGVPNEIADMGGGVGEVAQAPNATPREGGDPGHLAAAPEGWAPSEHVAAPEVWTPNYLVAPPAGGTPNVFGAAEASVGSLAQTPIATAPEVGTPIEIVAAPEGEAIIEIVAAPEFGAPIELEPS